MSSVYPNPTSKTVTEVKTGICHVHAQLETLAYYGRFRCSFYKSHTGTVVMYTRHPDRVEEPREYVMARLVLLARLSNDSAVTCFQCLSS